MSNTENGGPAFPCHPGVENSIYDGMTLRDYFAAKAMQGMIGSKAYIGMTAEGIARSAYAMADAMLEARKGGAA